MSLIPCVWHRESLLLWAALWSLRTGPVLLHPASGASDCQAHAHLSTSGLTSARVSPVLRLHLLAPVLRVPTQTPLNFLSSWKPSQTLPEVTFPLVSVPHWHSHRCCPGSTCQPPRHTDYEPPADRTVPSAFLCLEPNRCLIHTCHRILLKPRSLWALFCNISFIITLRSRETCCSEWLSGVLYMYTRCSTNISLFLC